MTHLTARFDAIDSAKGIGIILVVFGHAWRGAFGAGLIPNTVLFGAIDAGIYAFHMPLFFFLSGLLFLETLRKYDMGKLLKGRVTRLLWPMALWSWLFFGIKLLGGASVNSPVARSDMPIIPLPPYEHLWFLWALFLCQTLLILIYAVTPRSIPNFMLGLITGGVGLALIVINPYMPVPSLIWGPMVAHIPFFLIGVAIGSGEMKAPHRGLSALAVGVFAALVYLVMSGTLETVTILMSCQLIIFAWMVWLGADQGADVWLLRTLRYLGKVSMVIYLTHTIFSAALRIVMVRVGLDDLTLVLATTTLIGLTAPVAVLCGARKLRMAKQLGF